MKRQVAVDMRGWGLACLAVLVPAFASAQDVPAAATIPWIATAPRVPHDILSGVETELKGVELGFVPPPNQGAADFRTIDSVTIATRL